MMRSTHRILTTHAGSLPSIPLRSSARFDASLLYREASTLHAVAKDMGMTYPLPTTRSTTAEREQEKLSLVHSITLSARRRIDCGIVTPSAFAVLRLITSSNVVGCSTGISAGFLPSRTMPTCSAARRKVFTKFGP